MKTNTKTNAVPNMNKDVYINTYIKMLGKLYKEERGFNYTLPNDHPTTLAVKEFLTHPHNYVQTEDAIAKALEKYPATHFSHFIYDEHSRSMYASVVAPRYKDIKIHQYIVGSIYTYYFKTSEMSCKILFYTDENDKVLFINIDLPFVLNPFTTMNVPILTGRTMFVRAVTKVLKEKLKETEKDYLKRIKKYKSNSETATFYFDRGVKAAKEIVKHLRGI